MSTQKPAQWDPVRFLATLNYFGEVPFLGSFRWLQQLLGQSSRFSGKKMNVMKKKVAVLAPNLSPLAEQLPQRALTSVEWLLCPVEADQTWAADGGRKGAIAPFEKQIHSADTVAVLEDSEELALLREVCTYLKERSPKIWQSVFDFSDPDCDLSMWGALDDVVMGGVSEGRFFLQNCPNAPSNNPSNNSQPSAQQAVFTGNVSTDNSGGFSSVRTQNFDPPFDFSNWEGIGLRVKGDGNRYKFIARNSDGWDSVAYIYSFDTVANTWIEVNIPFAELVPTFRARSMPSAPAFDPQQVYSLQLMLSKFEYDRELNPCFTAGSFELAVSDLAVQRNPRGVRLVVLGSQDDIAYQQQQAILDESQVEYRLIRPIAESSEASLVSDLTQALTE